MRVKFYFICLSFFVIFIHGLIPHVHAADIRQSEIQITHPVAKKIIDLFKVDLGENHLEVFHQSANIDVDDFFISFFLVTAFFVFPVLTQKLYIPVFKTIVSQFNLHTSIVHRGPPIG
jgi:hypothetical protein